MADETSTTEQETPLTGENQEQVEAPDWESKFQAQKKVNKDLEAKLKDLYSYKDAAAGLEAQVAELSGKTAEYEEAKKQQKLTDEALSKANERILKAEIRAASASKLADPADALRFIDLSTFTVSDDGDVDTDSINEAVTGLLESKPYLAAKGEPEPRGDHALPPSGTRGEKPTQLTRDQLHAMSPADIVKAQSEGRLDDLLHKQ